MQSIVVVASTVVAATEEITSAESLLGKLVLKETGALDDVVDELTKGRENGRIDDVLQKEDGHQRERVAGE